MYRNLLSPTFIAKYLRYNAVGIVGTGLYLLVLLGLVNGLHIQPVIGSVVAFIINVIFNFVLSYFWVFKALDRPARAFFRFGVVSCLGFLLNTGIMYWVVHVLQWHYYFGVIFAAIVLPLTNFLLHHFWTFRR